MVSHGATISSLVFGLLITQGKYQVHPQLQNLGRRSPIYNTSITEVQFRFGRTDDGKVVLAPCITRFGDIRHLLTETSPNATTEQPILRANVDEEESAEAEDEKATRPVIDSQSGSKSSDD